MEITLLIFSCQGREHLLSKTFFSFKEKCKYKFIKTIVAIDGPFDLECINKIEPDLLIHCPVRKGYVNSIINAIKVIDTEYFFWLEDDFLFLQDVPIEIMFETLKPRENWAGIFLSRTAPLTILEKQVHLFGNFYVPDFGYSVSPALCQTMAVKLAFTALEKYTKKQEEIYGFETFMDDFYKKEKLQYALLDPGKVAHVSHFGHLESTPREYHMINSIDAEKSDIGREYISGFGAKNLSIKNKGALFFKIIAQALRCSFKLFYDRRYYDIGLRFFFAVRNIKDIG